MPTPGTLSADRFGYTGPISAPNIDPPPHFYRGSEIATFDFETSTTAAAAVVPEGLVVAHEPARARLMFANFAFSTLGAYREAMLTIACTWEGQRVMYCPYLIVTNDIALIAGREIWGAPKLFGAVGWNFSNAVLTCHVERPIGVNRVASAMIRPRDIVEPGTTSGPPLVFLKMIPSPERGAPPEVCELVEVAIDSTVQLSSDGQPLLFTGPASVRFDSPSIADPWSSLPVLRTFGGTYGKFDSVLGPGRVLRRFDNVRVQSIEPL